jgi:hypothetical protein
MKTIVLALLLLAIPAHAQQPPPPQAPDLQDIIPALEAQRNQALTNQALSEGRNAVLQRENAKLKAENEELRKKLPPASAGAGSEPAK